MALGAQRVLLKGGPPGGGQDSVDVYVGGGRASSWLRGPGSPPGTPTAPAARCPRRSRRCGRRGPAGWRRRATAKDWLTGAIAAADSLHVGARPRPGAPLPRVVVDADGVVHRRQAWAVAPSRTARADRRRCRSSCALGDRQLVDRDRFTYYLAQDTHYLARLRPRPRRRGRQGERASADVAFCREHCAHMGRSWSSRTSMPGRRSSDFAALPRSSPTCVGLHVLPARASRGPAVIPRRSVVGASSRASGSIPIVENRLQGRGEPAPWGIPMPIGIRGPTATRMFAARDRTG